MQELCAGAAPIPGASVEHNKFCVSVPFRNCAPADYPAVVALVDSVVGAHQGGGGLSKSSSGGDGSAAAAAAAGDNSCSSAEDGSANASGSGSGSSEGLIRVTRGRKVLEIRPQVGKGPRPGLTGGCVCGV